MKGTNLKTLVCIAVVVLLAGCAGHVVAEETYIYDPTVVMYFDTFVSIGSINLASGESEVILIFTDNSVFYTLDIFKVFFELAADNYTKSSDLNITEITGFGNVDGTSWFGKWTPRGGYSYYPLT